MTQTIITRKIRRNWEDYGALNTVKKIIAYLLKPVFVRVTYRLYRIRIDSQALSRVSDDSFEYRLIGPEDHDLIRQIEAMEEWLSGKLKEKLLAGDLCLVVLNGKRLAGFNLVAFGKVYIPLIKKEIILRPHEAWSEQITVHPNHRRQGLAANLRRRMFVELARRNVRRFYGGTLRENEGSLRLSRKVGFEVFVDVKYTGVLGYKTYQFRRIRE